MNNQLPDSIQKIINTLNELSFVDNTILFDLISEIKLEETDFVPYQTYNHSILDSYGRQLLIDNGKYKILLMSWLPGDFTAIHNHGFTEWGIVHFFGKATHRLYEEKDNVLSLLQRKSYEQGQNASVCGDLTHIMGNSSEKEFTTLHIYGSNTRTENISHNAKVYVPEMKKLVLTEGSAFLNMNDNIKLGEENFNQYKIETLIDYFNLVLPFYFRNNQTEIIDKINLYLKSPKLYYEI